MLLSMYLLYRYRGIWFYRESTFIYAIYFTRISDWYTTC